MSSDYQSPYDFIEAMDGALRDAYEQQAVLQSKHSANRDSYWPSMASIEVLEAHEITGKLVPTIHGSCLRQSWYKMNRQVVTDLPTHRFFDACDVGNLVEDVYYDRFKRMPGYRVLFPDMQGNKLRFATGNGKGAIRGELDLVIEHIESGRKIIVDVKGYDTPWKALKFAGYDRAKAAYKGGMPYIKVNDPKRKQRPFPNEDNLLQMMLYLEEFWNDGLRLGKLFYVARDKGPRAEFDISLKTLDGGRRVAWVNGRVYEQFDLARVHERFERLGRYNEQGALPPRDYVPEYDSDEILRNEGEWPTWVVKKVKGTRTAPPAIHRDWRCDFCSYLGRCLDDGPT